MVHSVGIYLTIFLIGFGVLEHLVMLGIWFGINIILMAIKLLEIRVNIILNIHLIALSLCVMVLFFCKKFKLFIINYIHILDNWYIMSKKRFYNEV